MYVVIKDIQKNVIGTYYLNIHFSLCTSQQTNTKQLSIETSKHYTMYVYCIYNTCTLNICVDVYIYIYTIE